MQPEKLTTMFRLRSLWLVAPALLGACSFINAPGEIDLGTGAAAGTGGSGGTGATTTSSTTSSTSTGTTVEAICGDGKVGGDEGCDDDNTVAGDGCSAACTIEEGWECTADQQELSVCQKICGNGTVNTDKGEQCDDQAAVDVEPPPGNQDYCSAECKFQEFDIESGADNTVTHELPIIAFRNDDMLSSFFAIWHSAAAKKIIGREYKFSGEYKKGTGTVDLKSTGVPNPATPVICTAPSNRSVFAYQESPSNALFFNKVDVNGAITTGNQINIPQIQPGLSCAANTAGKFVVAAVGKPGGGPLWDIFVQPFDLPALPLGTPIDIGDTLAPNATASWSLSAGFMVAWIADPTANGQMVAQQLDENGGLMGGFFFTLTDAAKGDTAPKDPAGARVGTADQFAFVYTRDSVPDMNGNIHREVAFRIFQSPGNGADPVIVSAGTTNQSQPTVVAVPSAGKFVVAWTVEAAGGENIMYRVFTDKGLPVGDEQQANEVALGKQTQPSITVEPSTGDVVILWDNLVPNSNKPHKVSAKIFPGLLK
ncbi:MAG: DUF4215 domain-containing protein [Polyangiaceae bacterium]|nr:DUF4215 domain-containing protein [Polyangiaceae bacterium]